MAKRILILPDAHYPHHDPGAMGVVSKVVETWAPDATVILGDWLDCDGFSSHARASMAELAPSYLGGEVEPCNAMLDVLQGPQDRPLIYLAGNHEHRVERKALELGSRVGHDVWKLMDPRRLLTNRVGADAAYGTKRKNFTWVPYLGDGTHAHYQVAKGLIAVHGWSHAKNAAQTHLGMARGLSVVYGHTHRAQQAMARHPLTGELIQAWSPGCLSKLVPFWHASSPNDWTHGISLVYVGKSSWTNYSIPIHPGGWCVLPGGQEIRG